MAVNTINFRFRDAESDVKTAALPLYVPTGLTLAQYQAFATTAAPLLDAASEAQLVGADMFIGLTVPDAGVKDAPVANALNERGGILGMETAGQFNDSIRIPAILWDLMTGDEFSVLATEIAAITLLLTAGDGVVFPRNREGFVWEGTGLYGKKSFRRK
jgi:hypothetical protein